MLGQHARIQGVVLASDKNAQGLEYCLGYGFAVCQAKEDVSALLAQSSRLTYRGRFITLREYKVGSKLKEDKKQFNLRRLFIGNVPQETSSAEIADIFERFGSIENVYFVNQNKEQSYKYGYIVFHDEKAAERALSDTRGVQIGDFKLRVEYFGGKKSNQGGHQGSHSKSKSSSNNLSCPNNERNLGSLGSHHYYEHHKITSTNSEKVMMSTPDVKPILTIPSTDALQKQSETSPAIAETSSAWRKALFQRHKTCSLEYQLQLPGTKFNLSDQPLSPLEPKNESNKLSTMISGQVIYGPCPNSKSKGDESQVALVIELGMGLPFLSADQIHRVTANHNNTNIRFNQPKKLRTRVYRR